MPIVFACVAPHGGSLLVPEPLPTPTPESRAAMAVLAQQLAAARPDSIAVLTPHGIRLQGKMSLCVSPSVVGSLEHVEIRAPIDSDLTLAWANRAVDRAIPLAPVAMKSGRPFDLDWGVTIPVSVLTRGSAGIPPLVVGCPCPGLSREHLIGLGESLADAAEAADRRVAVIISADQGHGHAHDGPYGFSATSAEYDQAMLEAICDDDLDRLLDWDNDWINSALGDSYWQTLALIGMKRRVPLRAQFLSYEVDHYFGQLCAAFPRAD